MRLYLIRHGQTVLNANQRCQGWTDIELDEIGKRQAESVQSFFSSLPLGQIYSSDLLRARQTAEPTSSAKGIPIQTTSLLRERNLGELENATLTELRNAFEYEVERTGESRFIATPMGVESAYHVMARVVEFSGMLTHDQGDIAVFTHGMTKEALLCHLIGAPIESSRSFEFENASISSLIWKRDVWMLEKYNDVSHLAHLG